MAEASDAEHGRSSLQAIPAEVVREYPPWWALVAHLLARPQRHAEAEAEAARVRAGHRAMRRSGDAGVPATPGAGSAV